MVKSMIIKCPFCMQSSEIYLSINPNVIVFNCPECWTPLIFEKNNTLILTKKDIKILDSIELENEKNEIRNVEQLKRQIGLFDEIKPCDDINPFNSLKTIQNNHHVITRDNIIDLMIDLEQCTDVQQFLAKI